MSKITDGGPAFPLHPGIMPEWHQSAGMSLRDWFAGQALVGILANGTMNLHAAMQQTSALTLPTETAYDIADFMLAARSKPEGE